MMTFNLWRRIYSSERPSDFPKATQLAHGRAVIQIQISNTKSGEFCTLSSCLLTAWARGTPGGSEQ